MKKYSRNAKIKIEDLPSTPNENKTDMPEQLAREFGEQIRAHDIEVCRRVPVANTTVN